MKALDFIAVNKSFKAHFWSRWQQILHDVTFQVHEGEIFGLLGPNGAGKSTLIKLTNSILFPDSGQIQVFGRSASDEKTHQLVGYMPEHPNFYDYLTGREFVCFMGQLFSIPVSDLQKRVERLLKRVGLEHAADTQLRKYSKGMLQRAGIAQALINDPRLVILDEPMSGLDPVGRREVRDIIMELKAEGRTVFFSSHILQDAELICDHVCIIDKGRVVTSGNMRALLSQATHSAEMIVTLGEESVRNLLPSNANVSISNSGGALLVSVHAEREEDELTFTKRVNKLVQGVQAGDGLVSGLVFRKMSLEELLTLVTRQHPSYAKGFNSLGVLHLRTGQLDQAASTFELLTREFPNYGPGFCNYALVWLAQNQKDKGFRFAKRCQVLDPLSSVPARFGIHH